MKIEAVVLENFRRYRGMHRIPVSDFTTIIGRNDVGKSTIFEALDIFFGGGTKLDKDDLSLGAEEGEIKIGVEFSGFPAEVSIDRGAPTSLASDYLLNENGNFEVCKNYNTNLARITAKICAHAMHPSLDAVSNLLALKNTELKKLVRDLGLEAKCDLGNNPSMRRALYDAHQNELAPVPTEVSLDDGDAAGIWKALERFMPIYTLFKSDRASTDQDPEAQDPMKAAVARAISELSDDLEKMADQVRIMVEETARRTIEQMQNSYPDMRLANELTPKFQEPKWSSIFKIDLTADDGIPLNKRGSGVRRLILMSFFQSEATRKRAQRDAAQEHNVPIIYAIEEPETSQHPDNQARIVEALQEVVAAGDQVLITTHNPSLAELLPIESIRFIDSEPGTDSVRVRIADDTVLGEVVETLSVLPAAVTNINIKVAVLTEGKTDIDALQNFYDILVRNGDIQPFDIDDSVFWAIGGGSTVKDWIQRKNLDKLNIPQVVIVDSDRKMLGGAPDRKASDIIDMTADKSHITAIVTEKREIENYLDPAVLGRVSNGTLEFDEDLDMDFDPLPKHLGDTINNARKKNIEFEPVTRDGEAMAPLETAKTHCKKVIASYLFANMTAEEIKARSMREDGSCEVIEWMEAIGKHVR